MLSCFEREESKCLLIQLESKAGIPGKEYLSVESNRFFSMGSVCMTS